MLTYRDLLRTKTTGPQDTEKALNRLNAWIRRCPQLVEAFADCSQSTHAKYFSPKAVRLITEYLGDP
jgi:hypothetical protein